jgi:hypothetical protein
MTSIDSFKTRKYNHRNPQHGQYQIVDEGSDWIQYKLVLDKNNPQTDKVVRGLKTAGYKLNGIKKIHSDLSEYLYTYYV